MINKSIVECSGCGDLFEKQTKYIKQSEKRGMKHYCSRSCMAKHDGVRKLQDKFGIKVRKINLI